MSKCFFGTVLIFMFGYAGDVSGARVAGSYAADDILGDGLDAVNAAYDRFGYSGSKSTNLELRGVWEINVEALEFEITDVQALDVLAKNGDGRPCLKDELRLCIIKAKYPTNARVTLTKLESTFLEGKRHFLKVKGSREEDAIYLHKGRTTDTIVIGTDGVGVYGGLTSSDCTENSDDVCKNSAVPANDDLATYFPEFINKDAHEIDLSARYEITVEAVAAS